MTADSNPTAEPQTPPAHHPCLSASEICAWRQGETLAPSATGRLLTTAHTRGRLGGFHREPQTREIRVDEAGRAAVVAPWLEAVEKMLS